MTFKTLLKRLQKNYSSVRAMGIALGISPERISRGTPFDVKGCLHLARVTGENPSVVLRAANKGEIATMIETLYGPGKALLTPEQQALLEALDAIREPDIRHALITAARRMAGLTGTGQTGSGSADGGSGPMIPPTGTPPDYKMAHVFARRARSR
jgi:hypothetical protein